MRLSTYPPHVDERRHLTNHLPTSHCLRSCCTPPYKNLNNFFSLQPSAKEPTLANFFNLFEKLFEMKFFCIFLPSNQKLALEYCIFIKIDSNFSNFISISFDKFFETGKFEVKSHTVHCTCIVRQIK